MKAVLALALAPFLLPTITWAQDPTYLGQRPPGAIPELFAPGVVSTDANEFSISFSPDGREAYFTRRGGAQQHTIMTTRLTGAGWTAPEPLEATRAMAAFEPCVSADGARLYFMSMGAGSGGAGPSMDQWYLERTAEGWSAPSPLGPPFNPGKSMFSSTTLDGALFTTLTEGGPAASDIGFTRLVGGNWSEFEKLGPEVNSDAMDAYPYVAPDGSYLIFSATRPDGQATLFVSFRRGDGGWTERRPIDLGTHQAGLPWVSPDGKYLFFSAAGDIYWVDGLVFTSLKPMGLE